MGARGRSFFTGRGDPGLLADFFFTFFPSSKILFFVFFRKNRISLAHIFGSVLVLDHYPFFSFFSFCFFCSDDIVRSVDALVREVS